MTTSSDVSILNTAPHASSTHKHTRRSRARKEYIGVFSGVSDPFCAVRAETALWRAVIMQALTDAVNQSAKRESRRARAEARTWLENMSTDFEAVCHHASFDPSYVKERARAALAKNSHGNHGHGSASTTPTRPMAQIITLYRKTHKRPTALRTVAETSPLHGENASTRKVRL